MGEGLSPIQDSEKEISRRDFLRAAGAGLLTTFFGGMIPHDKAREQKEKPIHVGPDIPPASMLKEEIIGIGKKIEADVSAALRKRINNPRLHSHMTTNIKDYLSDRKINPKPGEDFRYYQQEKSEMVKQLMAQGVDSYTQGVWLKQMDDDLKEVYSLTHDGLEDNQTAYLYEGQFKETNKLTNIQELSGYLGSKTYDFYEQVRSQKSNQEFASQVSQQYVDILVNHFVYGDPPKN